VDNKVGSFGQPLLAANNAAAFRMVRDALDDRQSQLARHPADFELVLIGQYDHTTGTLVACNHQNFGNMVQFLPQPKDEAPLLKTVQGGR